MLTRLILAMAALVLSCGMAAADFALDRLSDGGHLLMIRHARAPGIGDPAGFRVGDCTTQRNLDAAGRTQAIRLGERLKAAGVVRARVYSSQWCRCLETARLLGLGPVTELPGLNSFYGRPGDRDGNLAALRRFIVGLGRRTDQPVILVTHSVTIAAMTGRSVRSGEAVVLELDGTGAPPAIAAIPAG